MLSIVEHCQIAPPANAAATDMSFPLTFFDLMWMYFSPIQRLIFYELPISRTHFIDAIIPKIKNSLTVTLKHFFPLAGKLVVPNDSTGDPEIRYVTGDSVSLVFGESCCDFYNLTGNHQRSADEFHHLVPKLPEAEKTPNSALISVLSLQVTLFPDTGLCVGVTNHHGAGDASTFFNFMTSWAFITKLDGDEEFVKNESSLPFFDRDVIKDPRGIKKIFQGQIRGLFTGEYLGLPTRRNIRATFIMGRADVHRLKNLVSTRRPKSQHLSTFTVICAYVWTCMVRSRIATGTVDGLAINEDNEVEYFSCLADSRTRLDPPIPGTYLGNCLVPCMTRAKAIELIAEEGFITAAEVIGEAIQNRLKNEEGVLKGAEYWVSEASKINWERAVGVAGSPKFNYYDVDFGWGKPKKFEFVSIDLTGAMSLNGCRDSQGDVEVGLSLPKPQMDAFITWFSQGLKSLQD